MVRGYPPHRPSISFHNDDGEGLSPLLSVPSPFMTAMTTTTRGSPPCLLLSFQHNNGEGDSICLAPFMTTMARGCPSRCPSVSFYDNDEGLTPSSIRASPFMMTTTTGCPPRLFLSFQHDDTKGDSPSSSVCLLS